MTVEQVLQSDPKDPYSAYLVWRDVRKVGSDKTHVYWCVYDMRTGYGQGGIGSREFFSTVDLVVYVRNMVTTMNVRPFGSDDWPSPRHYEYTDWECGTIEDFAAWLKRSVGL